MIRTLIAVNTAFERSGEPGVPVTDQERETVSVILKVHQQITGLLDHPRARGMGGDPGQVHAASAVLDEEQHIQAAQLHRVDVEEIRCEDRRALPGQERPPGLPAWPRRGIDARVRENLPQGRRRHRISQSDQFIVDAPIAPARVVTSHLQYQPASVWPAWCTAVPERGADRPNAARRASRTRGAPPDMRTVVTCVLTVPERDTPCPLFLRKHGSWFTTALYSRAEKCCIPTDTEGTGHGDCGG
jgi:hypothetical protein